MLIPGKAFRMNRKPHIEWFMRRVTKLKRKGIMTEATKFELKTVHQSCRDCCFAEYNGKTQTGCKFGRLEQFAKTGTEVVQARDNDLEFELINGRKCTAYRDKNSEWAKQVPEENRASAVRAEITVRTEILIPIDFNLNGLDLTIESIKKLTLPASFHVINNSDIPPSTIVAYLRKTAEGVSWSITDIKERNLDGSRISLDRAVDLVSSKLKSHFYSVWLPGSELPANFTWNIDHKVSNCLEQFSVIKPVAGQGLTVAVGFHRSSMINGNKATPACLYDPKFDGDVVPPNAPVLESVLEKAVFLAKNNDMPWMVISREELEK
jgi:hypothetical protein